jgi:hypothetical protein
MGCCRFQDSEPNTGSFSRLSGGDGPGRPGPGAAKKNGKIFEKFSEENYGKLFEKYCGKNFKKI